MRRGNVNVTNPIASNSVNLCALHMANNDDISADSFFCITSTSRLVYNACPAKLSATSVLSTCIDLARRELDDFYISNAMCSQSSKLADICKSVLGEAKLDAVWCSWVLVTYLCSHPRGRDILSRTGLTDLDIQSAVVFERYGGEEIRRRFRQRKVVDDMDLYGDSTPPHAADSASICEAGKRKRVVKGCLPSASSDSHSLIEFWHYALQSDDVSVLHTLASHSKSVARDAALSTLARQADGDEVGNNKILQNVSLQNALKSAKALVSFVGRRVDDIPAVVALRAHNPCSGATELSCGTLRIDKEAASSSLHACTLPPLQVRPPSSSGLQIAWSYGAKKLMPRTKESAVVPGILERFHRINQIRSREHRSARMEKVATVFEAFVDTESEMAMPTSLNGTSRSFLSIATQLPFNHTHEKAASDLVEEANNMLRDIPDTNSTSCKVPVLLGKSQDCELRSEPLSTPASPLALGIGSNEILRRWMSCKTRKNDACKVPLGFNMAADLARESPGIMSSEPLPMLTITDINVECVGEESARDGMVDASLGVHVCADAAARVPDLLHALATSSRQSTERDFMKQCRAAIFVAASQASFVGAVASSLSSGYTNASVASSKKISVPDTNKIMLLSPYDAYVGGLCNIARSFDHEAYSGTYGCRVDTGWTPHGIVAHNFRSDKRQHGNCTLSEAAADELALAFGKSHWSVFEDHASKERGDQPPTKYYTPVPTAVRGIPHSLIPGVHTALNDYCDFVETYRKITEREDADTVDSIMVLPFSPFSQALAPDLEPTADSSLRTCFRDQLQSSVSTGRAFLPDTTNEHTAIVTEPLFRRPCQVSSGDCPFATSYENVDSFFNCANSMALLCRCLGEWHKCGEPETDYMHKVVSMFISGASALTPELSCWAADFLVLLNVLYPTTLEVGDFALLSAFEKAAPACQQALDTGRALCLDLVPGIQEVDRKYARLFWSAFCREDASKCAWKRGLKPLLDLILEHDGSHRTPPKTVARFKRSLEDAVKAVWLVHSPDGTERPPSYHPCSTASCFEKVARQQIDPAFVGSVKDGTKQRGCAVGLKPHSYRQVLAELMGAAIPDVLANVAINEGGMALRVSSDPTILDKKGKERTEKSISPVQTEGDERAYGTRKDKIAGAVAQKNAWDANALIMTPLFTTIEPPRHPLVRSRGEFGQSQFFVTEGAKMHREGQRMSTRMRVAKNMLSAASDPAVACIVNRRLC